jgi:hypothetical protein
MQSKSYHQQCATVGCANEADTRIALICRDCWNAAIEQASRGPLVLSPVAKVIEVSA